LSDESGDFSDDEPPEYDEEDLDDEEESKAVKNQYVEDTPQQKQKNAGFIT
jgi:hypothetical protein